MKTRGVLFTVQILIADRWIAIEDAQLLTQPVAHARRAHEETLVGPGRVRIIPVR